MNKSSGWRLCFVIAIVALRLATPPAAAQTVPPGAGERTQAPIVPLKPDEVLALLPAAPAGWRVPISKAQTSFMEWMMTQANREYVYAPPATSPADEKSPVPPQSTRVRITDTGYFTSFSGAFDDFKVGSYGNEESLLIESLPTRKTKLSDGGERLVVFVKRRFLVQIETRNQPANAALAWLKRIDLRRLAAVPDSGSRQLPRPIIVSRIDELEPKNNSSSQLYYANDSEMHPEPGRAR